MSRSLACVPVPLAEGSRFGVMGIDEDKSIFDSVQDVLLLRYRRHFASLFTSGEYLPVSAAGKFAQHVVAFARRHQDRTALVIVPRLSVAGSLARRLQRWGSSTTQSQEKHP